MDDSWKTQMGMPGLSRRRSTEDFSRNSVCTNSKALDPEDFSDVFGGPPRTVLFRQFSGDVNQPKMIYDEIFRPSEFIPPARKGVHNLPVFRIPARDDGFYGDIFGSDNEQRSAPRSMAKSKSNSSSVLSSEELSPLRPVIGEDTLSYFAAKLRPINVSSRRNSSKTIAEEHQKKPGMQALMSTYSCGFRQPVSSPETMNLEPSSFRSIKVSMEDLELMSPSSAVSSVYQEPDAKAGIKSNMLPEDEEDDEVMSSYVIEITSDNREGTSEEVDMDEVIAWAKQKFQTQTSETDSSMIKPEGNPNACETSDQHLDGHETMQSAEEEERGNLTDEEKPETIKDMAIEGLDEEIKLWSTGRETNIWLLLSTLHHILWANSGWNPVPLASLIESSDVRKAYQKARLCLHPDKLQQKGATVLQKHVADKVFSILQDAWAAFISQDWIDR